MSYASPQEPQASGDLPPLQAIKPKRKKQLVASEETKPFESIFITDEGDLEHSDHGATSSCADGSSNSSGEVEGSVALKISITEPLDGAVYIDGLMTPSECSRLCKRIDGNADLSFWSGTGREDSAARSFRDADTIEIQSSVIARTLWSRALQVLPPSLLIKSVTADDIETSDEYEKDTLGEWEAEGFNEDLLFARYPSLGSFAPHTDGRSIKNFNTRSFYSVIIFLNNIPAEWGGGTKFYSDEAKSELVKEEVVPDSADGSGNDISIVSVDANSVDANVVTRTEEKRYRWSSPSKYLLLEVEAVAGRCLIFDQKYVHEGALVMPPHCKYIIRSDVMFRRKDAICDTETDREAYDIYRRGEELSENGEIDEAIRLFKKAFRMSPALKAIYG